MAVSASSLLLLQRTRSQNLDHYLLLGFPRTLAQFWSPIDLHTRILDRVGKDSLNGHTLACLTGGAEQVTVGKMPCNDATASGLAVLRAHL